MKNQARAAQYGGVFVMILLMISLFAALSYALMSTSRSGSGMAGRERARISATELISLGQQMRGAVQTLRAGGCDERYVSFDYGTGISGYENAGSPADLTCHVFEAKGGGYVFPFFESKWQGSDHASSGVYFSASSPVLGIGDTGAPNTADLLMTVNGITKEICDEVNSIGGISATPDNADNFWPYNKFTGLYSYGGAISASGVSGKPYGCFYSTSDGMNSYVFYQVLIAR